MNVRVASLSKKYGSVRALIDVSITFTPGEIVAVLGPNGAGKTSLLGCLSGVLAADKGEVLFDDEPLRRDRMDLRRRFLFLPDFPMAFTGMTVLRHIGMVLRLYGADGAGAPERVVALLREFDLLPLADATVESLSRGQLYKTALAALIAADPELWLLDEPFASGMDPHGISTFKRHAREATKRGHTVIYSTQMLDAAERLADRVVILQHGAVRAFGSVAELQQQAGTSGGALEDIFRQLHEEGA